MKKAEVIKGNKLIAEFLGYTYRPDNCINGISGMLEKKGKCSLLLDHTHSGQAWWSAQSHCSWERLIPVCKKFDHLYEKEKIKAYKDYEKHCDNIDHNVTLYEITPVFKAMVAAIEWYNTTKK